MPQNLVIVESPAKAKTIEGFLGKDYIVKSSYGHVRDLSKTKNGVDIENNFEPIYEISSDKEKVIAELRALSKKSNTVWLATDEDREGEAISWHLSEALGLKASETKRIVFHEITKEAILEAIASPRKIDKHLVDAQQARRILDRLVGFELSPILWKKVKPSLSAGRVQSVAVRLIVEREREIESFQIKTFYRVVAQFIVVDKNGNTTLLKAELNKKFETKEEAQSFLEKCNGANFTIADLEKKPGKRSPAAPFTTSTLQQEASRKLGFSVAQTMLLAQKLYEAGKITYMRTDSVNLSEQALNQAHKEITNNYGEQYYQFRQYKTKSASAQEAHEAIRPTYLNRTVVDGEINQQRLYDLIWKRTIASQMAEARLEKTIVTIATNKTDEKFIATGEVILFDGFLKVYMEGSDDENEENDDTLLPPLTVGQNLKYDNITATQRFTHPPSRFTEASLVKKLEELGIGRPSTYAPTISTVQKRGYVVKEEKQGRERRYAQLLLKEDNIIEKTLTEITGAEKGKLSPTDTGAVVNDFLVEYFSDILDYNFTAEIEKEFDEIADGKLEWHKMIADFYKPFHKNVETTVQTSDRATGEREMGVDPKTGRKVIVRLGRFGPMAEIVAEKEDDTPRYASLRKGQRLETITLHEALDLFKLPRNLGQHQDKEILISIGRFGPYIKFGDEFISLPRQEDPYTIELDRVIEILDSPRLPRTLGTYEDDTVTVNKGRFGPYIKFKDGFFSLKKTDEPLEIELDRAIQLIEDKRKVEREKIIKEFENNKDIKVLNGRWGPYVGMGKKNARVPKGVDPKELTLEQCINMLGGLESKIETKIKSVKTKKEKTIKKKTTGAKKKTAGKKSVKRKSKK